MPTFFIFPLVKNAMLVDFLCLKKPRGFGGRATKSTLERTKIFFSPIYQQKGKEWLRSSLIPSEARFNAPSGYDKSKLRQYPPPVPQGGSRFIRHGKSINMLSLLLQTILIVLVSSALGYLCRTLELLFPLSVQS